MEVIIENISSFFNSHWLALCFLAPMFWAMINIIDVYFVEGIYKDEFDGVVIAGLFQIIPFIIALFFLNIDYNHFFGFGNVNSILGVNYYLLLAVLGGIFFNCSFYFYYKALFHHNDVALLQIFWGLTIVLVPLLSLLLWREYLSVSSYLGMAVVLVGSAILSLNKKKNLHFFSKYLWVMFGAVFFLSLSMVTTDGVYDYMEQSGFGDQGFLLVFICFTLGAFLSGLSLSLLKKRNPWYLIKKYWKVFLFLEGITTLGNFTSQMAINVSPSVSYVATIETFVPAFVLIFSLLILIFVKFFHKGNKEIINDIYSGQLSGVWVKILAILIMSVGIYIIS